MRKPGCWKAPSERRLAERVRMTPCARETIHEFEDVTSKRSWRPSNTSAGRLDRFLDDGRDSKVGILLFPDGQVALQYKEFYVFPSRTPAEGGVWLVSTEGLSAKGVRQLLKQGCELLPDRRLCVRIGNRCQWGQRIPWRIAKFEEPEYHVWPGSGLIEAMVDSVSTIMVRGGGRGVSAATPTLAALAGVGCSEASESKQVIISPRAIAATQRLGGIDSFAVHEKGVSFLTGDGFLVFAQEERFRNAWDPTPLVRLCHEYRVRWSFDAIFSGGKRGLEEDWALWSIDKGNLTIDLPCGTTTLKPKGSALGEYARGLRARLPGRIFAEPFELYLPPDAAWPLAVCSGRNWLWSADYSDQ